MPFLDPGGIHAFWCGFWLGMFVLAVMVAIADNIGSDDNG